MAAPVGSPGYYDEEGNWHDPVDPDGARGNPDDDGGGGGSAPGEEPAPTPTTPPPTPPAPTAPGGGQFTGTFTPPEWQGIPGAPLPELPTWVAPPAFHFNAPTAESIKGNQAYQFRSGAGLDALQRWAAAKGTLNDSGTANALVDYAGNSASQEYDNVFNRDWTTQRGEYDTNYNTQYVDPYKFTYQRGLDMNAPRIQEWQANASATGERNRYAQEHAWSEFMRSYDQWKTNQNHELEA